MNNEVYRYDTLPAHMRTGASNYLEYGLPPGDFLRAVLENDFAQAWARADEINTACMRDWAMWLWNYVPSAAWGSRNKVEAWMTAIMEERANGK